MIDKYRGKTRNATKPSFDFTALNNYLAFFLLKDNLSVVNLSSY